MPTFTANFGHWHRIFFYMPTKQKIWPLFKTLLLRSKPSLGITRQFFSICPKSIHFTYFRPFLKKFQALFGHRRSFFLYMPKNVFDCLRKDLRQAEFGDFWAYTKKIFSLCPKMSLIVSEKTCDKLNLVTFGHIRKNLS